MLSDQECCFRFFSSHSQRQKISVYRCNWCCVRGMIALLSPRCWWLMNKDLSLRTMYMRSPGHEGQADHWHSIVLSSCSTWKPTSSWYAHLPMNTYPLSLTVLKKSKKQRICSWKKKKKSYGPPLFRERISGYFSSEAPDQAICVQRTFHVTFRPPAYQNHNWFSAVFGEIQDYQQADVLSGFSQH